MTVGWMRVERGVCAYGMCTATQIYNMYYMCLVTAKMTNSGYIVKPIVTPEGYVHSLVTVFANMDVMGRYAGKVCCFSPMFLQHVLLQQHFLRAFL